MRDIPSTIPDITISEITQAGAIPAPGATPATGTANVPEPAAGSR